PVLYLDRENDDQIDEDGQPVTRTIGDWIMEAYGPTCPVLQELWGYHSFDDLRDDVADLIAPAMIVIDTVQSVVGPAGDRMRTDMVGVVEWVKLQVRRGFLVLLVSQVNNSGEFKESKALREGGWANLTVKKTGDRVEVRVGEVRHHALVTRG